MTSVQGSGLSDGEWVTLGAHEVDDLAVAVEHLRAVGLTTTIGLWGRSMGAVTAMAYARQDPSISGIVSVLRPQHAHRMSTVLPRRRPLGHVQMMPPAHITRQITWYASTPFRWLTAPSPALRT